MSKLFRRTSRPDGGVGLLEGPNAEGAPVRRTSTDGYPQMVGPRETPRPRDTPRDLDYRLCPIPLGAVDTVTLPAVVVDRDPRPAEHQPVDRPAAARPGSASVDPCRAITQPRAVDAEPRPTDGDPRLDRRIDAWLPDLDRWPRLRGRSNAQQPNAQQPNGPGPLAAAPSVAPPEALGGGLFGGLPVGGGLPVDGGPPVDGKGPLPLGVPLAEVPAVPAGGEMPATAPGPTGGWAARLEADVPDAGPARLDGWQVAGRVRAADEHSTGRPATVDRLLIFEQLLRDTSSYDHPSPVELDWRALLDAPLPVPARIEPAMPVEPLVAVEPRTAVGLRTAVGPAAPPEQVAGLAPVAAAEPAAAPAARRLRVADLPATPNGRCRAADDVVPLRPSAHTAPPAYRPFGGSPVTGAVAVGPAL